MSCPKFLEQSLAVWNHPIQTFWCHHFHNLCIDEVNFLACSWWLNVVQCLASFRWYVRWMVTALRLIQAKIIFWSGDIQWIQKCRQATRRVLEENSLPYVFKSALQVGKAVFLPHRLLQLAVSISEKKTKYIRKKKKTKACRLRCTVEGFST